MVKFNPGDRVRLNKKGRAVLPSLGDTEGTVVPELPDNYITSYDCYVRFDTPPLLHMGRTLLMCYSELEAVEVPW